MDMRQVLNSLNKIPEDFIDLVPSKTMRYEEDHYPGVYLEDLKEGDRLYVYDCVDSYLISQHYWLEIEITHIYGGVYFYKILDFPFEDDRWTKERHFVSGSILALKSIYPKKVVITKEYEFVCDCPRVEFIYDENMSNKYSSVFENTPERRYL